MHGKIVGLLAAAALLASVGIANAQGPVKLTDAQLDKVTAGGAYTAADLAANVAVSVAAVDTAVAANVLASAALNSLALNTTAAAFATAGAALAP